MNINEEDIKKIIGKKIKDVRITDNDQIDNDTITLIFENGTEMSIEGIIVDYEYPGLEIKVRN